MLYCGLCYSTFKESKNQYYSFRRHLFTKHNVPKDSFPKRSKWDSIPNGRVKDDADKKRRIRQSKKKYARNFRKKYIAAFALLKLHEHEIIYKSCQK